MVHIRTRGVAPGWLSPRRWRGNDRGTRAIVASRNVRNESIKIMAQTALSGTTDRRIDALLALLADNAMIVISGAKIAREIGVTRSTVWRWVRKAARAGREGEGPPARRLSDRKSARPAGAETSAPPAAIGSVRQTHPPFFQDRFHQFRCHESGRARRAARNRGDRGGTNGGPRPRRDTPGIRKNPTGFT